MTDPTGDLGIDRQTALAMLGVLFLAVVVVCFALVEFGMWAWGKWRKWRRR